MTRLLTNNKIIFTGLSANNESSTVNKMACRAMNKCSYVPQVQKVVK
jgi:hypothetical protein